MTTRQYRNVKNYRLRIKDIIIESMGGECQICNYKKCKAALEIHHVDPNEKEYSISEIKSWDKMCIELSKCILLCAICHREVHYDDLIIPTEYKKFDLSIAEKLRRKTAIDNLTKSTKYARECHKEQLKIIIDERKKLLLASDILFENRGWSLKVGKLLNMSPQKASQWVKKHLPEIKTKQYGFLAQG